MEINFFDSSDVPRPRGEIKIERLAAEPYPDGWRVKISIDVTPFQERPSLELRVKSGERIVAELSIIETMHHKMEFTVHIRGLPSPKGAYSVEADLYYDDRSKPQQTRIEPFTIEVG